MINIQSLNDEDFIKIYEELGTAAKIGRKYGCNYTVPLLKAIELNYTPPDIKEFKLSDRDKIDIINSYENIKSNDLAKKYSVSRGMITKIWYDCGLKGKEARIYKFNNQDFFHQISTEEQAYLLGFLAADGCVYEPKNKKQKIIRITIHEDDIEILEYYRKAFDTNKPISHVNQYVSLEVSSDQMFNDLQKLNITPRKTYKDIWVDLNNPILQFAYIRGYFDGDGSISKNFEINSLHSVNVGISGYQHNLMQFQQFLNAQNINSTFREDKREDKYTSNEKFGRIEFTNKNDKQKFLKAIYPKDAIVYLTRKFVLAQKFIEFCQLNSKTWTIKREE